MIKVAVIGLGNMGQHHAKAYAKIKEAHFVAAMIQIGIDSRPFKRSQIPNISKMLIVC